MTHPSTQTFETSQAPTWCPGCGDFAIWTIIKHALVALGYQPHHVVIVFGIGCAGNQANTLRAYTFHGLHGRPLPVALGVALANHHLKVIAVGGDGDGYGEGLAHFIHTIRANPNITYLVHDNQVYGLTKGQVSPTSMVGFRSDSTPTGSIDEPINPIALALAAGGGYVARGFAGDLTHTEQLVKGALEHRGFSFVDILQPCVTFNHVNTYAWFYQRTFHLEDHQHPTGDLSAAWREATRRDDKMPLGLFYHVQRPTYEDQVPLLHGRPLVEQPLERDITPLLHTLS